MFGAISIRIALTAVLALSTVVDGLVVNTRIITGSAQFGSDKVHFKISVPNPTPQNAGLNVMLHEDGGGSYDMFPNAEFKNNLIGVILEAPNSNRTWGGNRDDAARAKADVASNFPQGSLHSGYVDHMLNAGGDIEKALGTKFDHSRVFFTGASGGSLLLTGFFIPKYADKYNSGALLMCGGLPRQVEIAGGASSMRNWRLAFHSTQDELWQFKQTIPATINKIKEDAVGAKASTSAINAKYTIGAAASRGGHCGIDGIGLHSGIQYGVDHFGAIMGMGGTLPSLLSQKGIVGNENPYK